MALLLTRPLLLEGEAIGPTVPTTPPAPKTSLAPAGSSSPAGPLIVAASLATGQTVPTSPPAPIPTPPPTVPIPAKTALTLEPEASRSDGQPYARPLDPIALTFKRPVLQASEGLTLAPDGTPLVNAGDGKTAIAAGAAVAPSPSRPADLPRLFLFGAALAVGLFVLLRD